MSGVPSAAGHVDTGRKVYYLSQGQGVSRLSEHAPHVWDRSSGNKDYAACAFAGEGVGRALA